jgi:hypothetical protein
LKKRSKKLLGFGLARLSAESRPGRKSFLLLFFKKEALSCPGTPIASIALIPSERMHANRNEKPGR